MLRSVGYCWDSKLSHLHPTLLSAHQDVLPPLKEKKAFGRKRPSGMAEKRGEKVERAEKVEKVEKGHQDGSEESRER